MRRLERDDHLRAIPQSGFRKGAYVRATVQHDISGTDGLARQATVDTDLLLGEDFGQIQIALGCPKAPERSFVQYKSGGIPLHYGYSLPQRRRASYQ